MCFWIFLIWGAKALVLLLFPYATLGVSRHKSDVTINSLLPKIDELFLIGKFIKTDITGISGDSNRQLHFSVG